jgi:hypothetical protein
LIFPVRLARMCATRRCSSAVRRSPRTRRRQRDRADAGFGAGVGAGDRGESGGEFFDGVFVAESCEAIAAEWIRVSGVLTGADYCRGAAAILVHTMSKPSSNSSSYSRRATSMTEPHGEVR